MSKCPCGCDEGNEETPQFICTKCRGIFDCDFVINGKCICPWCEKDKLPADKDEDIGRDEMLDLELEINKPYVQQLYIGKCAECGADQYEGNLFCEKCKRP